MKNLPGYSTHVRDAAGSDSRAASSLGEPVPISDIVLPRPIAATPWERLVGAIDLSKGHSEKLSHPDPMKRPELKDEEVGVKVSRTAMNEAKGISAHWVKAIHPGHSLLAGVSAWETQVLNYLAPRMKGSPAVGEEVLLSHVVRIYSLELKPPALTSDFSHSSLYSAAYEHEMVVKTLHAGVSVDRLFLCTICSDGAQTELLNGRVFATALAPPGNLLRLIRKIIIALRALASVHVAHCDVAFRNMAVRCSKLEPLISDKGEAYRIKLNWDKASLIDFGASCMRDAHPKVRLPRNENHPSISARLRDISMRIKSRSNDDLLSLYRDIDWREDLYQLGYELRQWLCRNTLNRAKSDVTQEAISGLLWGVHPSLGERRDSLIDELLAWGAPIQCAPLKLSEKPPHQGYIARLDKVIAMLGPHDQCDDLVFHRVDSDPAYRREQAEARRAEAVQAQLDREALEEFRKTQVSVAAMREVADAELSALQQERQRLESAFEALHAQQDELAGIHAERAALTQEKSLNAAEVQALQERTATLNEEKARLAEAKQLADAAAAQILGAQQKVHDDRQTLKQERLQWINDRDAQVQAHLAQQEAAVRAISEREKAQMAQQKAAERAKSERDLAAKEALRQKKLAADQVEARRILDQLIPVLAPSRDDASLPRLLEPLPNLPYPPALVEIQCGSFVPGSQADGADHKALLHIGYRFAIGVFSFTQLEWFCYASMLRQPNLTTGSFANHFKDKGQDMRPAVDLSWLSLHDGLLPWLNKRTGLVRLPLRYQLRLPTEVEWEYVARAGRSAPLSAHRSDSVRSALAAVDQCIPNAWGICGMLGNVREWTLNDFDVRRWKTSDFGSNIDVPSAPAARQLDRVQSQVTRGVAWSDAPQTDHRTDRRVEDVGYSDASVGFRLAITLPEHGVFEDIESKQDPLAALQWMPG